MDISYESQPYLTLKVTRHSGPVSKNKKDTTTEPCAITQPTKIYMKEITESEISLSVNSTTNSSTDNIYLGATFDSYFTITNESKHYVRDVGLKIELQTNTQRLLLADNTANSQIPLL